VTRDLTLGEATADAAAIRRAAGECLKRVDLKLRLRLLGVRVGSLGKAGQRAAARKPRAAAPASDAGDELPFDRAIAPVIP
jgi:DNA polymerase IV